MNFQAKMYFMVKYDIPQQNVCYHVLKFNGKADYKRQYFIALSIMCAPIIVIHVFHNSSNCKWLGLSG